MSCKTELSKINLVLSCLFLTKVRSDRMRDCFSFVLDPTLSDSVKRFMDNCISVVFAVDLYDPIYTFLFANVF